MAIAAVVVVAAVVAGGGTAPRPAGRAAAPEPFTAGLGARSARVLPGTGPRRRPAVVFLHGWGLTGRRAYGAWLRHLRARGSTVIVPRYQSGLQTPGDRAAGNALAGVRAALRRLRPRPRGVVVAGHSTGGVIAVDYAVRAGRLGLPPALAVLAVYPGGALRNVVPIPVEDPAGLPASLRRLVVIASPYDQVVGTGPAEELYGGAVTLPDTRRRLVLVDDRAAGDHFAPVVGSALARRVFWPALDRLVDLAAR